MPLRLTSVSPSAREGFRAILSLPDETLRAIGQWVKEHIDALGSGEVDDSDIKSFAAKLDISTSELGRAISLAMTVIMNAERPGEIDGDVAKSLELGDRDGKLKVLLAPISSSAGEISRARQKGIALKSAIPTLDDVNALCDLRAIFEAFPSGSQSKQHISGVVGLLGFEPVVVVSLELNDSSGNDRPSVFQVSEQGLRNLIKTLEESLAQLEIVKREVSSIPLKR